jgi:lantibiotic leader peptide-processing serine protease
MRRAVLLGAAVVAALGVAALAAAKPSDSIGGPAEYVVVYDESVTQAAARAAVQAAGGTIVRENRSVGVATIRTSNPRFLAAVAGRHSIVGAARNAPIGRSIPALRPKVDMAQLPALRRAARGRTIATRGLRTASEHAEPLAHLQWGMRMIGATPEGSYAVERGERGVRVGIIDTGVDGSHPDIAPNFNQQLSRNFTTDIPLIDGPCAEDPDGSCDDPADVDENSHGTHVASIVGSPINNLGVAGVAPRVSLVNLRAGQDSGFFFLQATVDALVYAGLNKIDVVNMSYFIDPWLYNCVDNPADSPEAQAEQRTIIEATQRALDFAHAHGVTLVAAEGNGATDLGAETKIDTQSPNFPPGSNYMRTVDNGCLDLPTEGNNVLSISALGPTTRKADYSNYGVEQTAVSAPGGWFRDDPWVPGLPVDEQFRRGIPNLILAAYPESVGREFGDIGDDGLPTTPFVLRDCRGNSNNCGYYQYLQGTSMASPHAAGVAALIVAKHGKRSRLSPERVQEILQDTATDHACPEPRLHSYADKGRPPSFDAFCDGSPEFNGFYGHGIVNALAAVQ